MTPFGLRKKLQRLMGDGGPSEIITHPVTYLLPNGTEQIVEAEEGYNLLMASEQLPSPIGTGRRAGGACPDGRCGACRVEIIDGRGLSSLKDFEVQVMAEHTAGTSHEGREREAAPPAGPNTRLACQTRILGPGGRVKVADLVDFDSLRGEAD
jgi:ferredoxin